MGNDQALLQSLNNLLQPPAWAICRFCGGGLDPSIDPDQHECKEWAKELPREERDERYQRAKSYCVE